MKRSLLMGTALYLFSLPSWAATELIELGYRSADEVLPVVQSVLGYEGKVSAYGNKLIINAEPAKIAEIRQLLGQLDTAPKRLLISVDTQEAGSDAADGYQVDGSARIGDVEIGAGQGRDAQDRNQVRIIRHSTASRGGGVQQVQATEGYPAQIQIGQSVPLTSHSVGPYGQVWQNTQYQNVSQGFYVTAQVIGQNVQVTLSSNNDKLSQQRYGAIDTQQTDTRISGPLGQWLTVGGSSQYSRQNSSGVLNQHSTSGANDMNLRIKVEVLP